MVSGITFVLLIKLNFINIFFINLNFRSEAVELVMKPRDGEPEFMTKMREFWWETRDAEGARRMLHKTNHSIEAKLLYGLAKHDENDIVNALEYVRRRKLQ